ncbi:hypothetical protein Patl1_23112 [Pistacia atlantica]|uniref:Uncharacterized protein n=1 Tax=Pistacia atlantica TaxID=434234 RepID=A0ACC0ZWP2_9ROSI|nr:hypothetical protein Patl1_23112 [Pistacia atlantica]
MQPPDQPDPQAPPIPLPPAPPPRPPLRPHAALTNYGDNVPEWSLKHSTDTGANETQVVLLKLCNQAYCLLIKLDMSSTSIIEELSRLLVNKDLLFAGVNIQKDLELLRKGYGLEIKSYLELSELAAQIVHHPPQPQMFNQALKFCTYSIRGLASEILSQPLRPRPLCVAEADWSGSTLTEEQIEYATVH